MKRLTAALLSVFILSLAFTIYAAQPDQGAPGPRGPAPMKEPAPRHHVFGPHHLNLTAQQKDKLTEIENRFFQETRDLRYEAAQKRLEMRKLFTDPKVEETALLAKNRELTAVEQKLHEKRGLMKIESRRILTPEQLRELDRAPLDQPRMAGPGMGPMAPPPPPMDPEKGKPGMHAGR